VKRSKRRASRIAGKRRADMLFSKLIRLRDGRCRCCHSTQYLQCAHGFSRRYTATRWDARNAWALCRACHTFYTYRPIEWDDWMREEMGTVMYEALRYKAHGRDFEKPDYLAIIKSLELSLGPYA
jgi:hypothetical protein